MKFIASILFFAILESYISDTISSPDAQETSLRQIFDETRGKEWPIIVRQSWDGDYCSYHGVTCDQLRRVISLDLSNNPDHPFMLQGTLSADIFIGLPFIQHLQLGYNYGLWGPVPSTLKSLKYALFIGLGHTSLSMSNVLDVMPNSVIDLKLSYSLFYGDFGDITRLPNLKTLSLISNSDLTGSISLEQCKSKIIETYGTEINNPCIPCYGMDECSSVTQSDCEQGGTTGLSCGGINGLYCLWSGNSCVDSGFKFPPSCLTMTDAQCQIAWWCKLGVSGCSTEGNPSTQPTTQIYSPGRKKKHGIRYHKVPV